MQTLTLSDNTIHLLSQAASLRGVETSAYAEELLQISLAVLKGNSESESMKTHIASEFSAMASTNRSATEIDAEIEAGRAEWDRENYSSQGESSTLE